MRTPPRSRFATPPPVRSPVATGWVVWDRFLQTRQDTGFRQSSWWAEFGAATGIRNFGVVIRRQGIVIGGGVVHTFAWRPGEGFFHLPEGPVLPDDPARGREVFAAVLSAVRHHRHAGPLSISHLRLEPRWRELPGFLQEFDIVPAPDDLAPGPRHTLSVDLRNSETGVLARMTAEARSSIALARRLGVTVVEDGSAAGIADFLALYPRMTSHPGPASRPDAYFTTLIPALTAGGRGSLLFAQVGEERLAAALVVYFGIRGTCCFAASNETHRERMAPYLLQFEGMRHAKGRGCEWYDLGGIGALDPPDPFRTVIPGSQNEFGGTRLDLVPALDLIFDRGAYARYLGTPVDDR